MPPLIELFVHVDESSLHEKNKLWMEQLQACLPSLLAQPKGVEHILSELESIEISIVDDTAIASIHAEFLDDPSPTDVITFPHGDGIGEIIVSLETAKRSSLELNIPWQEELFRYMVHGLVHLHGYLDATPEQRAELYSYQEPIVKQFSPLLSSNFS